MTDEQQDPRIDFSTLRENEDGTWEVLMRARVRIASPERLQATMTARVTDEDGNPNIAERSHAAQVLIGMGLVGLADPPEVITVHVIADPSGNDSMTIRPGSQD
jgi:hypothetical protein